MVRFGNASISVTFNQQNTGAVALDLTPRLITKVSLMMLYLYSYLFVSGFVCT